MINANKPFTDGMDLYPLFKNRKFKKSDFIIPRRFYVAWSDRWVVLVTHKSGVMYYIERVVDPLYGAFTREHVYCTPLLDRALAAAEFCTLEW